MRARSCVAAFAVALAIGCLFDPKDAEGLDCYVEEDCGPELDCVFGFCVDPGGDDGTTQGTTAPGDGGDGSPGEAEGPVPPGDGGGDGDGDDGGPIGCEYTGDGECDEPEGTNFCPEGTDIADCAPAPTCSDAGESCSSQACCDSALCVGFDTGALCADQCSLGSDCASCCCGSTDQGESVCAPDQYCEGGAAECVPGFCGLGGSPCFGNADCCDGLCLENTLGSFVCFKSCSSSFECESGCCSQNVCQTAAACG